MVEKMQKEKVQISTMKSRRVVKVARFSSGVFLLAGAIQSPVGTWEQLVGISPVQILHSKGFV